MKQFSPTIPSSPNPKEALFKEVIACLCKLLDNLKMPLSIFNFTP
ncbi:hypothetical protein [Helicobacter pylori]|uniref:Uncharacterized protein n=1 Tax=Helicobacter pylori SouthAfrica50 TaxID=1352357 RepID=T2S9G0_HELPX|nr:hypothetical protein [Helicobacter pylori]EQD89346.1 hypothetical protein HPSA50_1672 [Helicobacter pylori SouthAfrica50]